MLQPSFMWFLSLLLSWGLMLNLSAQRLKVKFGKLSKEEYAVSEFPGEPDAAAIILYERNNIFWDFSNSGRPQMVYQKHLRIKILDESAIDPLATIELDPYYSWRSYESVTQIKGFTYNETEDGKIERVKLGQQSIFADKIDKRHTKKSFAMPQVKVGSVIEISYRFNTARLSSVSTQRIQEKYPKMYVEISMAAPQGVVYSPIFLGEMLGVKRENGISNISDFKQNVNHYFKYNVPAFQEEAFTGYWGNHAFRVQFNLSAINVPGLDGDFRQTWGRIYRIMVEDEDIEPYLMTSKPVNSLWKEIQAGITEDTPENRLSAIITHLRSQFTWDGNLGLFPDETPVDLIDKKEGDGASLNMLLVALCREAGLQADPVLISTREHGDTQRLYAMLNQFNHVIVRVGDDENHEFVDVASKLHGYRVLPLRDLNGSGFLLGKTAAEWVIPASPYAYSTKVSARMTLMEDGSLEGVLNGQDMEYAAMALRDAYDEEEADDEFVATALTKEMISGGTGEEQIENLEDVNQPLKLSCQVQTQDFCQAAGDRLYLEPMLFERIKENPFKEESRRYPVDYIVPRSRFFMLSLKLPEGYEIESQPEGTRFALPDGAGSYTYQIQALGSTVQILSHLKLNKAIFSVDEYGALKVFYDLVLKKQGEQLVLKKAG